MSRRASPSGPVSAMRSSSVKLRSASCSSSPPGAPFLPAFWNVIEPEYVATLHIPLLAGRDFNATDRDGAPKVAVIGEATARRFWPDTRIQDVVGQYVLAQFFQGHRLGGR